MSYISGTLGKGWNVKVITNGSQSSSELTQTDIVSCLLFLNRKNLYAPNNPYIENLINAATSFIEKFCGRRFKKTTYTNELVDGDGSQFLFLNNFPIITVTSIYWHWVLGTDELLDSDYYKIYSEEGYIFRSAGWTLGKHNIKITYEAGYDFTTDGIPAELQDICNSLVSSKYVLTNKLGIKSEKIGQYAVTYSDNDVSIELKIRLENWRKPNVF